MNPNATLMALLDALHGGDRLEALDQAQALAGWIFDGGELPSDPRDQGPANLPCPNGREVGDHLWTADDPICRYCGTDMSAGQPTWIERGPAETVTLSPIKVFPNGWVWGEDQYGETYGLRVDEAIEINEDEGYVVAGTDSLRT